MKLRQDIQGTKFDPSTGKRALDELQSESKRLKTALHHYDNEISKDGGNLEDRQVGNGVTVDSSDTVSEAPEAKSPQEKNLEDKSSEHSQTDSDSSEYESEEDDEEEALMAELAKIRKEREEQKKSVALSGNPLFNANGNEKTAKTSWRSSTPFARKESAKKDFTTSTLESDTHRQFMSKYFR